MQDLNPPLLGRMRPENPDKSDRDTWDRAPC